MMGKTNIQISRETKALLDEIGKKSDTYDDIVRRCVEAYIKQNSD